MIALLDVALAAIALGLLVPAAVLLVECAARLLAAPPARPSRRGRPSVAVIVPAHDEAARIDACVASLRGQLAGEDRVVVVADNCADDTATRAREHGATVLERNDDRRRGKGYALRHALDALAAAPPDVVIVIDADSAIGPGLVETLAHAAAETRRPVQAAYHPELPPQAGPLDRLSALAFAVKNVTRPTGLARLGLPCLLTGTGMAFPWAVVRAAPIVGDRTAEDMRLAVDLAIAGHPPVFCPDAHVAGPLLKWGGPPTLQRTRWEHGHLETIAGSVRPLLAAAVRGRRLDLVALALELAVPPLSLWAVVWAAGAALAAISPLVGGSAVPLAGFLAGALFVAGAILIAWARDGRAFAPARTLPATVGYVLRKLPMYASFPRRRQSTWAFREVGSGVRPAGAAAIARAAAAAPAAPPTVTLGGLCEIHSIGEADLVEWVLDRIDAREGGWIVTVNLDHLWHFQRNPGYAALCARATLATADGMPLVWASRLQGTPLPGRVAGSDLVSSLSAAAAKRGRSVFLVGGMPGVADAAAEVLRTRHPELRVAGVLSECEGWDPAEIAERIRVAHVDIVYISLGKIAEERLIERLLEKLPGAWFMGVGTSFAFLSGHVRRAPRWMREAGLEWLCRWGKEPARLTPRYLRCMPVAMRLLGGAAVRSGYPLRRSRQMP